MAKMIKEYGGKEKYPSKMAMMKHEGKEGMKKEKSEGMMKALAAMGKKQAPEKISFMKKMAEKNKNKK